MSREYGAGTLYYSNPGIRDVEATIDPVILTGETYQAKALETSESGKWKESLIQATRCVLFLGTPLNDENLDHFRSALRACMTIESGSVDKKVDKLGAEDAQAIQALLLILKKEPFPIMTIAEKRALPYGTRFRRKLSRVIVDKQNEIPALRTSLDVQAIVRPDPQPHTSYGNATATEDDRQNASRKLLRAILLSQTPCLLGVDVQNGSSGQPERKSNHAKCHHIPFPENPFFKGRQDTLKAIKARLVTSQTSSKVARAFALWGVPGQGKTQTALRFAFDSKDHFPYIFWVTADREEKLLQGLHDCAVAVGLREPATDVTAGAKIFVDFLPSVTDEWLLIFDNATDHHLINKWWPYGKHGAILITARSHVFATSSVANAGMELDKLPDDNAIDMILAQVPRSSRNGDFDEREEALKIVKRVSGLALGVQAAVGLINETNYSLKRYNAKYTDARAVLKDTSAEQVHRNFAPYPQGLYEVLTETIANLSQDARMLIEMFALLDPDRIQDGILETAAESESLKGIGFVQNETDCMKSLMNGLIASNGLEVEQRFPSYHIHRLLQKCVIMDMTETSRQRAFDIAAGIISSNIGAETTVESAAFHFKEYFPHVQSLHDFFHQNIEKDGSSNNSTPLDFIQLLRKGAAICYRKSLFNTGLSLIKTGQDILGEDPQMAPSSGHWSEKVMEAMRLHYSHACIGTEVGDFKLSLYHFQHAKSCHEKVTSQGCTGATQTELRNYVGGIANSLNGLGRHHDAEGYYLKSLELGKPNDIESPYEVNICRCRWAAGDFKDAEERLLELIELREKTYKQKDDTKNYIMGHMLYVLGNIYISQKRLDEANTLHKRALKCWIHTFGEEHHKTGDAWHKRGWHKARRQKFEKARKCFEKALGVYMSGSDQNFRRGEIARSNFQLARVLKELGLEESKERFERAEELRKDLLGSDYSPQANEEAYDNLLEATGAKIYEIDYLEEATIVEAAKEYGSETLDCLINCAAFVILKKLIDHGEGVSGGPIEWQEYNSKILTDYFQIMVVGPLLATKHFQANLEKSKAGKIVNISSSLGSISGTVKGTKVAYRIAKAGLNQETRTIAMDLKNNGSNVTAMVIDPGAVATRLSGWNGRISVEESVNGIYVVIDRTSLKNTGKFWRWNGEELQY
ncbi:MAG: hypothetical protein Q9170_004192 [Blastenia crenularia]